MASVVDRIEELNSFSLSYPPNPSSIVFAETPRDVQGAVLAAVQQGRGIAVQSTGHGRFDTSDDAVLITTQRMTGIEVDPTRRTARIAAGVRWGQVIAETTKYGLAPVHGSSPTVGVMGYTLSGGIGLLSRKFGYAADTVLEVELVTASGALIRVTPNEYEDLFWAVRGGKGSFGIATAIEVPLFPVPSFYGGALFFHPDAIPDVLPFFVDWVRTLPDWFAASVAIRAPVPEVKAEGFSHLLHLRCTSVGDSRESSALLAPIRTLPGILTDAVDAKPYSRIREVHNDGAGPVAFTEKSRYLPYLSRNLLDEVLEAYPDDNGGLPPYIEFRHLGGEMTRSPVHANCVGGRGSEFSVTVIGRTEHSSRARAEKIFRLADAASAGQPVLNFQGDEVGPERVLAAYDPEDRERLLSLKRQYDPENVFRHGHVIAAPAAVPASWG
ncbi:FAD-binding oxidoreductase [Diaminobutyricimonas sp. LJ205]|uniref:FAD-binding oxidoreductase n=1 Tax=Diaminobutyricimonas sp. LJ205 TaxID=2683590 RepID=UPI0012F49C3A|nr:FAD-binding oxidoreductase [Diaminobutyricimonas sp. LJ205]